jgi:hypothetical protein
VNVEAQIRAVFESRLADGTPWQHPNAPISIVATKGRCVHVRLSGAPDWTYLAFDLLGDGNPCAEFRLEGRNLFARLKTPEQLAADDAAIDFDDAHGELFTHTWPEFEGPPKPAKQKRRKVPEGAATVVMQVLERDGDSDIDDLTDAVRAILPAKIDGEGKDRTTRYIRAAIEKLESLEYLSVGEDRQVSLA